MTSAFAFSRPVRNDLVMIAAGRHPRRLTLGYAACALAVALLLASPAWSRSTVATPDPIALQLASIHTVVTDLESGERLYAKHPERAVPVASVTKLMTAVTVLESDAPLDEWLTIQARENRPPNNSYSRMRVGSQQTRGELLRLALMSSENLAAYNLAQHHPGGPEAFVEAMNANAKALGMHNSRWVGPSGLSERNRSTAADLIKLLRAAVGYETIRRFTQTDLHTATFRNPSYRLRYGNTNPLVHRDSWDVHVSKTGYLDAAGRCLATVVEVDGRRLAIVVLDALGKLSPVGDVGRIARWVRTGKGGPVAAPALAYARRKSAALEARASIRRPSRISGLGRWAESAY